MGSDKAFLPFGGTTLIEWMLERLAPSFAHTFVVGNEPSRFRSLGFPVVTDAVVDSGSAVGIYSAVLASPVERVLCVGCDMPFITVRLLRCLAAGSAGYDVFLPRHGTLQEPLCAVYSRSTLPLFERLFAAGEHRVGLVNARARTGYLDVADGRFGDPALLFSNANTPQELEAARARAAQGADVGATDPDEALAERVRRFMDRAPVPVVSFVGKKKSAKTTVLLAVIAELVRRGHRVGAVKHDTHGFSIDVPGTDSYRLREAGAVVTGIASPDTYVWINDVESEPPLAALVRTLTEPVDLLITEGFKRQDAPKIEVSRRERSTTLIADEDELLGIVSDQAFPDYRVPQFALEDAIGVADLVEARIIRRCREGLLT